MYRELTTLQEFSYLQCLTLGLPHIMFAVNFTIPKGEFMFFPVYILSLLLSFALPINAQDLINNQSSFTDLKTMIGSIVPLRADGKMHIPAHIKHVKLDIGLSNHAPMSQYWLTHEDDLLVFGFEPSPRSVDAILNGKTKWHQLVLDTKFIGKKFFLIPCALGLAKNRSIKFYVTGTDSLTGNDCGCSSIYIPKYFDVCEVVEVPIFSLSDFFDLFPFDTHPVIDYIKIDAQGADLDIAKSAGHYLAERVVYITLEAENDQYKNTVNSFQDVDNYMKRLGFVRYESHYTLDPTYFNPRYLDYVQNHHIQIFQG